jgi:hypothetical protein
MTAIPIPTSFVTPPASTPSQAFGGVLELSQLLMTTSNDSKPVVCTECRTINLASAKLCKGCDGKLPAYYAASDAGGDTTPDPKVSRAEPAPEPRVRTYVKRFAPWSTVMWAAVVLVGFYVAFGLWYAFYSASTRMPSQPLAASVSAPKAVVHAPISAQTPEPNAVRAADALNVTLQSAPAANHVPPEAAPAVPQMVVAPVRVARADLPRAAPSASSPPRPTPASYARGGSDPLAMCRGRDPFTRAICMNNSCAQRASASHPGCADVLRQRRLDEARRNPTLLN